MVLGENDTCGISREMASWKSVSPVSLIMFLEITCTGVVVDFNSCWWPLPVTTTGLSSNTRLSVSVYAVGAEALASGIA